MPENVPPRAVYNAAVTQRTLVRAHVTRVEERVARYDGVWEVAVAKLDLAKWRAIEEVLEAICDGKTVQPS